MEISNNSTELIKKIAEDSNALKIKNFLKISQIHTLGRGG